MSLSDLAAVGSFLSGIAVVVTLLFLLIQMRQTNRNQQSLMQQGRATRNGDAMLRMTEPHLIDSMILGPAGNLSMSPAQVVAFVMTVHAVFMNWEDSFLQHKAGTIDASSMESDEAMLRAFLAMPGYRAAWKTVHRQFNSSFREYIDGLMLEQRGAQPRRDLATAWKAHLTEELAAA